MRTRARFRSARLRDARFFHALAAVLAALLATGPSLAWVYPEHRAIAAAGVAALDAERRAALDELWAAARASHHERLCEAISDPSLGEKPTCIDWVSFPAISGDHSCSSAQMIDTVLESRWILKVASVTARLERRLAAADTPSKHNNVLRDSDIQLQRADPQYATRAGSNNVHFLLALPAVGTTGPEYGHECLSEGSELNALGAWAWYHVDALEKAARLGRGGVRPEERSALALALLADEAYALHFLEDAFAAGHVAGTWGNAALRKGTHDYYNEHGLAVTTWDGKSAVLTGDAYMRPEDQARAAASVRRSLEQMLDALGDGKPSVQLGDAPSAPDDFDTCTLETIPARDVDHALVTDLNDVLVATPVPGLAQGLGELPRFRAELGPFVGLSASMHGWAVDGGFGESQDAKGALGGLGLSARIGMGLEGVMNASGDGLVFVEVGLREDLSSTSSIDAETATVDAGAITSAIPGRAAYTARIRVPFWLVPLDLLVAAPFLLLLSPKTLAAMAVRSANGGLIPWQAGLATPIGRFQFVLGREIGASFFGYGDQQQRLVIPPDDAGATYTLVGLRSIEFDFPIVEYRPFRRFSRDQSSSLLIQVSGGFEKPGQVSVVAPLGAPEPDLKTFWHAGFRLVFDWRSYW